MELKSEGDDQPTRCTRCAAEIGNAHPLTTLCLHCQVEADGVGTMADDIPTTPPGARLTDALRAIARDLHWMARRYADGRRSYATSLLNEHTRALLAQGVDLNPTADGTIWARDADGRGCDHLTDEEAAAGRPPDWWHRGPDAREEIDRLSADLANERARAERAERDARDARAQWRCAARERDGLAVARAERALRALVDGKEAR